MFLQPVISCHDLVVDRRVRVVMASNHVEFEDGWLLWLDPSLAQPGDPVWVVRYGAEFAVWTAEANPNLLVVHRPGSAGQAAGQIPGGQREQPAGPEATSTAA